MNTSNSSQNDEKYGMIEVTSMKSLMFSAPKPEKHKMYINDLGRLGNHLFKFACLVGITNMTGHIPRLTGNFKDIWLPFPHISIKCTYQSRPAMHIYEEHFAKYPGDSFIKSIPKDKNIYLSGYFQSWKYFSNCETELRKQLTLNDDIRNRSQQYLLSININNPLINSSKGIFQNMVNTGKYSFSNIVSYDIVFIGVHIRKSDMATIREVSHGYNTASAAYIQKAMKYYTDRYPNAQFVIVTDDILWVMKNVPKSHNVHMPRKKRKNRDDLALIASCNHTIMTTGTFGWWGAWLAGGEVVYYSTPYRQRSNLWSHFSNEDHFPPHWVPLSD